jgi:hypothetical protein
MARSRTIKPGFFMNESLGALAPICRLLFVGLWTVADREGRLEDRPARIRAEVLPYDDLTLGQLDELLGQLDGAGFIVRYEIDGHKCIQVLNFGKHQKPHPNERASGLPLPENIMIKARATHDISRNNHEMSCADPAVSCSMFDVTRGNVANATLVADETPSPASAASPASVNVAKPRRATTGKPAELTEEFIDSLQADPAYERLDVRRVVRQWLIYCDVNHRVPTKRFLINWLNRQDQPIARSRAPDVGRTAPAASTEQTKPVNVAELEELAADFEAGGLTTQAANLRRQLAQAKAGR